MEDQREFFREVSALANRGEAGAALRRLRDALARHRLDAAGIDKAGTRCADLFGRSDEKIAARVLLLGQFTTTWLRSALIASAWGDGRALEVAEGAYDNVMQELLGVAAAGNHPDVVVLLPWNQRLFSEGSGRSPEQRIADEIAFWQGAWRIIEGQMGSRIIQVGYDTMTPGVTGYLLNAKGQGDLALVRRLNQALRSALPGGAVFIDLEPIAGEMGRRRFFDPRRYHWTKQPFSEAGIIRMAEHLSAGVRALMTGPKKVLVLDLDNTLWGGVVGETGPLGITIGDGPDGEAYRCFQSHVKRLSERGVVLAVCSKNNDADAREPFQTNANMVLSLDDFAQFEATWDPKAVALRRIAKTLQLGLDSFVFVDDNPAEREHIRQALPEVSVVELPEDPAEYVQALDEGLWFETVELTDEDRVRAAQYLSERRRRDTEVMYESLDEYLASLEMVADVRPIEAADLDRVVQLIAKTNQFNLTTRRHGLAKLRQMLDAPGTIAHTLRVADRFGDHGLVAVLIAVADRTTTVPTLEIDTWLMSCRVINRTVEEFFFNSLVASARSAGIERLVGVYVPTKKNALVKEHYERLGFARCGPSGDGQSTYELRLTASALARTFVKPKEDLLQTA